MCYDCSFSPRKELLSTNSNCTLDPRLKNRRSLLGAVKTAPDPPVPLYECECVCDTARRSAASTTYAQGGTDTKGHSALYRCPIDARNGHSLCSVMRPNGRPRSVSVICCCVHAKCHTVGPTVRASSLTVTRSSQSTLLPSVLAHCCYIRHRYAQT
jgi:hypothetical protein